MKEALSGFAVGNPIFYCEAGSNGRELTLRFQMYFHHGLMSHETYAKWAQTGCDLPNPPTKQCQDIFDEAEAAVGTVDQQLRRSLLPGRLPHHRGSGRALRSSLKKQNGVETADPIEANFDPDHKYQSFCLGNATLEFGIEANADTSPSCHPLGDPGRMSVYLNRKDVQAALHIDAGKMRSPVWTDCAEVVHTCC